MPMHSDWSAAKADSEKKFKIAYGNWVKELQAKAEGGDDKAKLVWIKEQLGQSGLDKGFDFTKYMDFSSGFGPALDALEKMDTQNSAKVAAPPFAKIIADANLKKAYLKVSLNHEVVEFCLTGYKLPPDKAITKYDLVKSDDLNAGAEQLKALRAVAGDPQKLKKDGPALLKKLRDYLMGANETDLKTNWNAPNWQREFRPLLAKAGDIGPLKKKCLETATAYFRQAQAYHTRWSKMQPDFATPLMTELNSIVGKINKMDA